MVFRRARFSALLTYPPPLWYELLIDGSVGCSSGSRRRNDEIQRESVAVGGELVLLFGGTTDIG